MNYMNPPAMPPKDITHKSFYSNILRHEIGYNIYLPPNYGECGQRYPTAYHIHGWQGNESSEIAPIGRICRDRQAITVFINAISSESDYFDAALQIESILIHELIPYIDQHYRTIATRENRMISGFSMGGMFAFYYAVRNLELLSSVTAYAGTYHHQYHKGYNGVGEPPERAAELYQEMIRDKRYLEENNILCLVRQNADKLRRNLNIDIHIGTDDVLFCDNEIMHLFLTSLDIPHSYKKFIGAAHDLNKIL